MTNTTTTNTIFASMVTKANPVVIGNKEVSRGFVIEAAAVMQHDLGEFFGTQSAQINKIVILPDVNTNKGQAALTQVVLISGVKHRIVRLEVGTEQENWETYLFLLFCRHMNSAILAGRAGKLGQKEFEYEVAEYLDFEEEQPAVTTEASEEVTVQEEEKAEEVTVPEAPKSITSWKVIQGGVVARLNMGELVFGIPSSFIHKIRVEETVGRGFTGVQVLLKDTVTVEGFAGTFGAETAVALASLAKDGVLPASFVSPEMLVQEPAESESLEAVDKSEESVEEMTQVQSAEEVLKKAEEEAIAIAAKIAETNRVKNVLNANVTFKSVLQEGPSQIKTSKSLRLRAGDKSPQVMSVQGSAYTLQAFVVDVNGNITGHVDMDTIFDEEAASEKEKLDGVNIDKYSARRVIKYRKYDGTKEGKVIAENLDTYTDSIIFVATEHNKVEYMKLKQSETAYILSNESAQSRVASQGKVANVEVYNSQREIVRLQVQDATNLAVMSFNMPAGVVMPDKMMNQLFHVNGVYFRTRTAPEDVMELTSIEQLVQYQVSNDTPSQKRQAKATFFANTDKLNVHGFLQGMGNRLLAYGKADELVIDGVKKKFYKFDIQKNSSRLGLLGSASKELKFFSKKFGKIKSRVKLADGIEVVETTTGLKVLNCPDVVGQTTQVAKVFNAAVRYYKPGHSEAMPSVRALLDWVVNLTDGGIISDAGLFAPMLRAEGLVAKKRNGRMRGYAHQFRMNFQVKGLNVVVPGVKELTGFDMILFDGARKTDLLALLEDGEKLEYHVMLVASTFKEDDTAGISAQAMNNLDMPHEVSTAIANESIEFMKSSLHDVSKREEAFAMMKDGKDLADMASHRNVLSKPFGIEKFALTNPAVWEDFYAKTEINAEIVDFVKTHKGGYLHVNAKNNYMFTDLYAVLKAVGRINEGDFSLEVQEKDLAAKAGEVILPMMKKDSTRGTVTTVDKDGKKVTKKMPAERFFYEGDIISIRSPHVVHDETQFAKAINPLLSSNKELVKYYRMWLSGGFIDGITFFSAVDIMVPASSGADFDGDTSLIIIDARVVASVEKSPQFVNFYTYGADNEAGITVMAYDYNDKGVIVGGFINGKNKLATMEEKLEADEAGTPLKYVTDSKRLLGEGCPWKNPAAAPAFNLPEGMFQDNFNIYIPADMLETDEAYVAWTRAVHTVIGSSITSSDIGQMSNVVMAITNAMNFVKKQAIAAKAKGDKDAYNDFIKEFKYLRNMREVFVAIVWYSIDAAKHGGYYKAILESWMKWCSSQKAMRRESERDNTKSMARVVGPVTKEFDVYTRETMKTKYGVQLPNVIREAKYQMPTRKGGVPTNLQLYSNAMKEAVKLADKEKNNVSVVQNNLRGVTYTVLNGSEINSALAKKIYDHFANDFDKQSETLKKEIKEMERKTAESLAKTGYSYDDMPSGKQSHAVKKIFGTVYQQKKAKLSNLLSVTRQKLRMAVIAKGMDVVDFAAVVYNHVYDKAIEAEHRAGGKDKDGNIRGSKAGIYILWKLMDEFLIYMLSSVEGTRIVRYEEQNVVFELTSLYFHPTEAFKAKASTILADNNAELAGKELALGTAEGKGMNVYLVEEGADYTDADLIGRAPVSAVYNLVHDFTYRISNVSITSVSNSAKGGVTMDLGKVLCFGNRFEGIKPAAAKAFFDRTASANKKYPIALIGDATMETLQSTNKFIATNNSKGVTFFAIETADGLKAVAKSLVTVNLKEGVKIELDAQASDFTGDLTLYVYASSVVTK